MIDTHCHLDDLNFDEINTVIENAAAVNVNILIISGCGVVENNRVVNVINKFDNIYGTIGIHPSNIDEIDPSYYSKFEELITNNKIVAIGEIGLDYHYENINKENQKIVFEKFLDIALKYNLPVVIHSRNAANDTYNILKQEKYKNLKGVIHCFSYSLEMANLFIKLNYLIGIGGVVTFKNAVTLKKVVENISIDNIVLETDSPYLSPVPFRGKINEPKNIKIIAEEIANIKKMSLKEVDYITTNNATTIFNIKD